MARSKLLLTGLIMNFLCAGISAHAAFQIRTVNIDKERYLLFADVSRFYGMAYTHREKDIRCQSRYSLMTFKVDDRRCKINTIKISLCLPIKQEGKNAFISEKDFRLSVDPVLRTKVLRPSQVRTIVIDAGHGGKDTGALGKKTREKDITLSVAKLAAYSLKKRGYKVYLTRTRDTFLTLEQRVKAAAKMKPDVFISLHANSAGTSSAKGIESFAVTPQGTSSTNSKKTKSKATAGNTYDRENMRLSYELLKYLLHYTKGTDRGVKRANFVVIRDAVCPSALVEMGFLSNADENKKLGSSSHQRLLASGIVHGIIAYDKALRAP